MSEGTKEAVKFTKGQLMAEESLKGYGDILAALIKEGERLSLKEANQRISRFLGKKV